MKLHFAGILCWVFAAGGLVAAQEFDKAKGEFKRGVAAMSESEVGDAAERLAKSDNKEATDVLLDGYGSTAAQIKQLWAEKMKWVQVADANSDIEWETSDQGSRVSSSSTTKFKKLEEAQKEGRKVEKKIMEVEGVKRRIVTALAMIKSDAAVKELISRMKSDGNPDRRAGACEALGLIPNPEATGALLDQLRKDAEMGVKVACIDGLKSKKTPEVVAALSEHLKSEFWQVTYSAAIALRDIGNKDAVDPIIDALAGCEGRLRAELNDVLVALTGVDKHADPAAWKAWWGANGASVREGKYTPAPDEKPGVREGGTGSTFYGIPIKSKSLIFVLDTSGSMVWESEWKPPPTGTGGEKESTPTGGGTPPPPPVDKYDKPDGNRKIDILKWELKRCLARLAEGTEFNLVIYGSSVRMMADKPMKMSAVTRKIAIKFVDELQAEGGTNTFDALEKAFAMASAGAQNDKLSKSGADTFYLMSDGIPTAGQITDTPGILTKVKELNRTKKIVINTIGAFSTNPPVQIQADEKVRGEKFLTDLAKDNGGVFVNASGSK